MKLQDLIIVFDRPDRPGQASPLAQQIATANDAHLTGFCPLQLLMPSDALFMAAGMFHPLPYPPENEPSRSYEQTRMAAHELGQSFLAESERNGLRASWQVDEEPLPAALVARAQESDLIVLNQPDPESGGASRLWQLVEDVLFGAGRPILMVPYTGRFDVVGRNVLVGWDGSRAATRAIHDSLPLLRCTERVTLLTIEQPRSVRPDSLPPGTGMAEHLARHNLRISLARTVRAGSASDTDIILNHAADTGADLLVVGAYGHSRAREILLGGVTRALVDHATIPVLMSH